MDFFVNFSKLCQFFLIFFMKLRDHKHSEVTKLDFSGRFPFAQKRAKRVKNALRMTFLIIYQNCVISFSDFLCMKLGYHKHSKVTQLDFSGRFSFAKKTGKKGKKCPKMTFFIIYQNCVVSFL